MACFYPIFVPIKQKQFIATLGLGAVTFVAAFIYSIDMNPMEFQRITKIDVITAIFTTCITGLVLNHEIDKGRVFYGEALERFSIIGEISTAISHNVKGMISSPLLDIEVLKGKLSADGKLEYATRVSSIYNKIEKTESVLRDMNYIAHVAHEKNEWVSLSQALLNSSNILNLNKKNIEANITGNIFVYTDRRHIEALLLSLILNSIKSYSKVEYKKGIIQISLINSSIVYRDDGGGFDLAVMSKLNKGQYLPQTSYSGLGLTLARRMVQRMGGSLKFSNNNGAVVEIKLPKSKVKSS